MNFARIYARIQRVERQGKAMPIGGSLRRERAWEHRLDAALAGAFEGTIETDADELAALSFLRRDAGSYVSGAGGLLGRVIRYRRMQAT